MASEASSGQIPTSNLLQGSQAVGLVSNQSSGNPPPGNALSGNSLPAGGNPVPAATVSAGAATASISGKGADAGPGGPGSINPQTLIKLLNKNLNDSGRPDQFRLDPASDNRIQQINPANGQVIGEFSVDEFPALARSIGATGLIVNSHA